MEAVRSRLRHSLLMRAAARRPLPTVAQLMQATRSSGTAAGSRTAAEGGASSVPSGARSYASLAYQSALASRSVLRGMVQRVMNNKQQLHPKRVRAYSRTAVVALRQAEANANNRAGDAAAQVEYLRLLNESGFPHEVLHRFHSGKFASSSGVLYEVNRAMQEVHGALPPPPAPAGAGAGAGAAAAVSSKAGTQSDPLHVIVSGKPSALATAGRILSVVLIVYLISTWTSSSGNIIKSPLDSLQGNPEHMKEVPDQKFDDVKGCDEAKEELEHIVDYLKHKEKYAALGGKVPKGILLTGPPGTGKTLLARAIAGEAGVPFFSKSASEFEEMLVGLGASRVRKLFEAAAESAPCIVFIDEIDAIGGKRMKLGTGGYDRQTLNQLLASMDGFVKNEGVIVLAATNFPEALDAALTRPGRFDVSVRVGLPDVKGREEIIKLYLSKTKCEEDVDALKLARATPGMSGADLESLVNQAVLRAAQREATLVAWEDLDEAKDKLFMGPARKNKIVKPETLRKTAYHEGGHTLVALLTRSAMPIYKTTVLPRGMSAGATYYLPEWKDEGNLTRSQVLAQLDVAMGGRVAEELIYGEDEVTTGAGSDMENASSMARNYVMRFSMSKLGLSTYSSDYPPSQEMQAVIDREVNELLDESYKRATSLLVKHRKQLDLLADALVKYETLSVEDMKLIIRGKAPLKAKEPEKPDAPPKAPKKGGFTSWFRSSKPAEPAAAAPAKPAVAAAATKAAPAPAAAAAAAAQPAPQAANPAGAGAGAGAGVGVAAGKGADSKPAQPAAAAGSGSGGSRTWK